ncbi:hypothetical protein ACFLW6_00370 [Chloroflexota bacterium]
MLVLVLLLLSSGTAYAAEPANQAEQTMGMNPITFALVFLGICIVIGIVAVLLPVAVYIARVAKTLLGIPVGEMVGVFPMFYSSLFVMAPVSSVS